MAGHRKNAAEQGGQAGEGQVRARKTMQHSDGAHQEIAKGGTCQDVERT